MTEDIKKIQILAISCSTNREIESVIGRALTQDELIIVDKARVSDRLKRKNKKLLGTQSGSERYSLHRNRLNMIELVPCEDMARRDNLESKPAEWLKHYLADTYTRPFEKLHHEIIEGSLNAAEKNTRFAIAGERGIGKSVVLWGIILYLALSRKKRFPVCVPWESSALKRAFRFWRTQLCFNSRLRADYPEFCLPFWKSKGVSQRIVGTWWAHNEEPTGAQIAISDGLIVLPDNLGCFGGVTINSNPRGLNHALTDGTVIRPDIALLDDVQDRQTAKSSQLVQNIIDIIDGDVAGMGESGKDMPMLMSGNCIEVGDVMDNYLSRTNWKTVRVSCVEQWPDGWEHGTGELFDAWERIYISMSEGAPWKKTYNEQKEKLTKNFKLSSPSAFKSEDRDSFCAVMCTYFKMGYAPFMAERQQTPVKRGVTILELKKSDIMQRMIAERAPLHKPEWATCVIAATDINPNTIGATTAIIAFGQDQRAAVMWYGVHEFHCLKTDSGSQIKARVMKELEYHGKQLYKSCPDIDTWIIDGGGTPQNTVIDFAVNAKRTTGLRALCSFGRASKNYRAGSKNKRCKEWEQCCVVSETAVCNNVAVMREWAIINACYWREQMQRAWLAAMGAPGSIDLPSGHHDEFADQLCREQLSGKGEIAGKMVYIWNTLPGPHEYSDCCHMAFAAAAMRGIGTGGGVKPEPKKARVVIGRPSQRR